MRSEICGGYNWSFFEAFFPALKSIVSRNIEKARKISSWTELARWLFMCVFVFFLQYSQWSSVFPCVFKHVFGKHGNPPCCVFKFPLPVPRAFQVGGRWRRNVSTRKAPLIGAGQFQLIPLWLGLLIAFPKEQFWASRFFVTFLGCLSDPFKG